MSFNRQNRCINILPNIYFWKYRSQWSRWTKRSHLLRAKSLCQDFSLPRVLFLQQGDYRGKKDVDWTAKQHLKEFFFHRTTQEGEIKEQVKQLMFFCINCDSGKKNLHIEIKLRCPGQTEFFLFLSFLHLDWAIWIFFIGPYLLMCECEYSSYFAWKKSLREILMIIWIKSDVVLKFITQYLSYTSVEE